MYQDSALQSFEDHKRENAQFTHSLDLSNFNLPPYDQFEAFRFAYQGVMDVSVVPDGLQSFPARQTVWNLDKLAFMRTKLPGEKHAHRQKHLKTCVLDHWYINLPFRSPKLGNWHEAEIAVPELHCLATPFDREIDHDGVLTLFIPHDLFASTAGLHRMLDVKFEGGLGKLLADYLFLLDRSLADLQSPEIPYIVEATRSLVAVCLAPSQDRLMEAQTPIDATLLGARAPDDRRQTYGSQSNIRDAVRSTWRVPLPSLQDFRASWRSCFLHSQAAAAANTRRAVRYCRYAIHIPDSRAVGFRRRFRLQPNVQA